MQSSNVFFTASCTGKDEFWETGLSTDGFKISAELLLSSVYLISFVQMHTSQGFHIIFSCTTSRT